MFNLFTVTDFFLVFDLISMVFQMFIFLLKAMIHMHKSALVA